MIPCVSMTGTVHQIRKGKVKFRPSVYGVIVNEEGHLLVSVSRSTGKYTLPGGGVDVGETLVQALHREALEECNIRIKILKGPLHLQETFFYYEPLDRAWQCYLHLFVCRALTFEVMLRDMHDDSIDPHWLDPMNLAPSAFQIYGQEALDEVRALLVESRS